MNDIKYTGGYDPISPPKDFSEIELQIDNIYKAIEVLYYQITEMSERLKPVLAPEYPQDSSGENKRIRCSISPLGEKLESIHTDLQYRIESLKELNIRIKL
jgi:hypothetical protein